MSPKKKEKPARDPLAAHPRSIRVTDARWAEWNARAEELGVSIAALMHLVMTRECKQGDAISRKPRS